MKEGSRRAIVAAFLANLGIAAAKFTAWGFTGAASMLAEAVHSVADTGNQALLFLGGARARRVATPEHPFGYGRERYFWGFVVALVLFSVGALFALWEGIQKVFHPHAVESPEWAVGVLGIAIVLESFSFRTAIREARPLKGGETWWRFIRHTKEPELPVVLLEDLGALVGLVLALAGVGLALATGDPRFDALGSVAIGLLLGVIAVVLATEMKSMLIGEGVSQPVAARIRSALEADADVRRLIHLKTLYLGPDELLVAAKLEFDPRLSFAELARAIDRAEQRVRNDLPSARLIYLEPDVYRGDGERAS